MYERGASEIDVRDMLERARQVIAGPVVGRFIVASRLDGIRWQIVVEPDEDLHRVVVVTVYHEEDA
jgi:hypothetical protein